MNFKRVISFGLLCLLLVFGSLTTALAQENSSTFLENIKLEDIGNHSDIENFIREQGFEQLLESDSKKNAFVSEEFNLQELEKPVALRGLNISEDKLDEIVEELGLGKPEPEKLNFEENLLIKRFKETNTIANIWYLRYSTSDSAFSIDILNVGKDPIDSISGKLTKYNNKNGDWTFDNNTLFNVKSIGTGNVYRWIQNKDAVSDYFEYSITVTEDNTVWYYANSSGSNKYEWQRYNFDAGLYSEMQPLGGQRHHVVSAKALKDSGISNTGNFPAIRMMYDDHQETPSWGNSHAAQRFKEQELEYLSNQDYKGLMRFEVDALKEVKDPENKFSSLAHKYNDYLVAAAVLVYEYFGVN
ncbi:Ricin B-type lectin domain-containing protein [Brevibacillus sp. IT-7CA2]|uniref:hypothetical protein n=1 Tax=Brevibacillus sp. IT-7CA2 TaxID=3026436 RepID=UPI0039E18969